MQWRKPCDKFCDTNGCAWKYQTTDELESNIGRFLLGHYTASQKFSKDKQAHPIFLMFSGAGTGKSRFLDEFPEIAARACKNNLVLQGKIENAYIFHVGFENGTRMQSVSSDANHIGCRMYYQLHTGIE